MSADDDQDLHDPAANPQRLPQWDVFSQGLPSDPRGRYFRLLADPRPEEVAAVAGSVEALEAELARLAELAEARPPSLLAEAALPQTEATFGPPREAARLAGLQAAQAALRLAAALLQVEAPEQAQAAARAVEACAQAIATWKRSGRGWFESRHIVKGYYAAQLPNEQTGGKEWWWIAISYGPYRYFRWRAPDPNTGEPKLHTRYLGKQEAADTSDPTTPPQPGEERPLDQPIQRKPAHRVLRPPRQTGEPPRGGRPAKLTPQEVEEVEAWLAEQQQ